MKLFNKAEEFTKVELPDRSAYQVPQCCCRCLGVADRAFIVTLDKHAPSLHQPRWFQFPYCRKCAKETGGLFGWLFVGDPVLASSWRDCITFAFYRHEYAEAFARINGITDPVFKKGLYGWEIESGSI